MAETPRVAFFAAILTALLIGACGNDGEGTDAATDTGRMVDTGVGDATTDTSVPPDAGEDSGTGMDAAADTAPDASSDTSTDSAFPIPDAGDACHGYDFGEPPAVLMMVASVPAMTGGTIPLGIYDLVAAQTTSGTSGTIRSTWVFETDTVMQTLDQLALGATTPPPPTPRSNTWSTSGTRLLRARNCEGTDGFDNGYTVRVEGGATMLDVESSTLLFTFRRRL